MAFFDIALSNLISPVVLFFVLGSMAALARSDLSIPEAIAKTLALYLMLAIGFKGGVGMSVQGFSVSMLATIGAGIVLSAMLPLVANGLLQVTSRLPAADCAAISGHYGSISIVTLLAVIEAVKSFGGIYEGYLVAVAAVMELPAILTALWLARCASMTTDTRDGFWHEILLQGPVVMLAGAFIIGWLTGEKGLSDISPFIVDPFKGILCFFMIDMGLLAGRGLRKGLHILSLPVMIFGFYMPVLAAFIAAPFAYFIGLSAGGAAVFMTLAASASYIAVPAAMRIALPQAEPAVYLTLSLGVTFPFNLTLGIPIYMLIGQWLAG